MSDAAATAEAYAQCEAITRRQAANFYYGIRLLPRRRRRAMSAVYAFARRIDDIGDGPLEAAEKLHLLEVQARLLARLGQPAGGAGARGDAGGAGAGWAGAGWPGVGAAGADPVMVALADAHERFSLPPGALAELIEGVRMDVQGVTYERFEELVLYCRRVAGAVGRTCLAIFGLRERDGCEERDAQALADDLGVALQLTNILRDVREDAENGRVYLPAEDLVRFGLLGAGEHGQAPAVVSALALAPEASSRVSELVRFEAERAQQWFDRGIELAALLDRRSAACVLAMAGIYQRLLVRIETHPEEVLRGRISLPAWEKGWVAASSMLVRDRSRRGPRWPAGKALGGHG